MHNPLFSVIIPHKNTPELLKHCLKSIPRMDHIQIIVVDDNSNESIVDINMINDLKDDHTEIYLTKEGKGAGYARNTGLKYARGKWLIFADADDYFPENAFDIFFTYANSTEDIIYFKSASFFSDTNEPTTRLDYKHNRLIDDYIKKEIYSEDRLRYLWSVPWAKMIKKELIDRRNISFDETPTADDLFFSYMSGHYATSIIAVDKVIYMIAVRRGSLTNVHNFKMYKTMLTVFNKRNVFLRKIGKKHLRQSVLKRFLQKTFGNERIKKNNYGVSKYIGT